MRILRHRGVNRTEGYVANWQAIQMNPSSMNSITMTETVMIEMRQQRANACTQLIGGRLKKGTATHPQAVAVIQPPTTILMGGEEQGHDTG